MFESLKKKFSKTSEKLEEELIEEAEAEDNLQEESGSRFSFFSFGRKKEKPAEEDNLLPEAEEEPAEERDDEEVVKEEKKSRFWSRNKSDEETPEEEEEETPEEEVEGKKSHFWSRSKDSEDEDSDDESEEEAEEEKKSHFWSRNKDKDKEDVSADGEAKGGLFSFVREKTIQEKHVEDILFELEMELLQGDVAMEVATEVVDGVKDNLVGKKIKRSNDITEYTYYALRDTVAGIIDIPGKSMTEMLEEKKAQGEPLVVMFVGINGTGKTTTIGKLANYYLKKGYTPVIAASDTFRAGAIEQVTHHADNVGVKIIKHQKGSDPAAVAYDAVEHAKAQGKELVLIDTAGRMQTNTNLMDEMKKIKRVSKPDLVIFVGDAITGNDATEQARKFNEAIDIDGVILTKADADSKGGASLSIGYVIKKPIMFLGVGQGYDDIMEYDAEWMLNQLFSEDEEVADEA
ncbi:MAG: signal recognition particle-docking protein FtsY [Methanobrevibacter sp.]|nr:signal recognition particle-docking protein FtsY [Methanobrevibacter sp.]